MNKRFYSNAAIFTFTLFSLSIGYGQTNSSVKNEFIKNYKQQIQEKHKKEFDKQKQEHQRTIQSERQSAKREKGQDCQITIIYYLHTGVETKEIFYLFAKDKEACKSLSKRFEKNYTSKIVKNKQVGFQWLGR